MKTFVGLFGFASLFGLAIAVTYWFVAHEEGAGTALLGFMFAALAFATGYAILAERDANLEGDDPCSTNEQVAGEEIDIVTKATPYPGNYRRVRACAADRNALVAAAGHRRARRHGTFVLALGRRECARLGGYAFLPEVPMARMKSTSAPIPKNHATKPSAAGPRCASAKPPALGPLRSSACVSA